jgi:hypothetical protein
VFSRACIRPALDTEKVIENKKNKGTVIMPKFITERSIPNAGKMSPAELKMVAQRSCAVLRDLGPDITWIQSYVADDKIYCINIASSEKLIREHGCRAGFPVDQVREIQALIDPATAE